MHISKIEVFVLLAMGLALIHIATLDRGPSTPAATPTPASFESGQCDGNWKSYPCRFKVEKSKTFKVTFMPKADFDPRARNAEAYTYLGRDPCEVVLPTGVSLVYNPRVGKATWDFAYLNGLSMQDVVAHEFLHCLIGAWHGTDAELAMTIIRDNMQYQRRPEFQSAAFGSRLPYLRRQSFELHPLIYRGLL